jgi:NADPH2:quinone reductase
MRVLEVQGYGGVDELRLAEWPDPAPVPGKVRVRMAATAVNPTDIDTREGAFAAFAPGLPKPFALGWDIAGTLLDYGGGFVAGQSVVGMYPWFAAGDGRGTNAEIIVADPAWLAVLPDNVPWTIAATVPLNAQTAKQALGLLQVKNGDTVLVSGASGGVGSFAVQFAVAAGLHVIAIASAGDEEFVGNLGAKEILTRDEPGALVAAVRASVPGGVDAVLDPALVSAPLLGAVRDGGGFVTFGDPAQPPAERGIEPITVHCAPDGAELAEIIDAVAAGELVSRVAHTVPIERGADAHRELERGGVRGKIVLTF